MTDLQWLPFQCDAVYMQLPQPMDQRRDSIRHFYCVLLVGIAASSRWWRNGGVVGGSRGGESRANARVTYGRRSTAFWSGKVGWEGW